MLVTTHTIVATTIAYKTKNPWIYIPAVAISHPLLDLLPHFGDKKYMTGKYFKIAMISDAIVGVGFFVFFVYTLNFPPLNLFLIDLLAGWPDLVSTYHKLINHKHFEKFTNYHALIQKFESPAGILVEIAINVTCLYLIFSG